MWGRCWWTFRGHLALFDSTDDLSNTRPFSIFLKLICGKHTSLKGYLSARDEWFHLPITDANGSCLQRHLRPCVHGRMGQLLTCNLTLLNPTHILYRHLSVQWPLHNTTQHNTPMHGIQGIGGAKVILTHWVHNILPLQYVGSCAAT